MINIAQPFWLGGIGFILAFPEDSGRRGVCPNWDRKPIWNTEHVFVSIITIKREKKKNRSPLSLLDDYIKKSILFLTP
jgi:hypothetical protein